MSTIAIILAAYGASLAVVFYGFFAGWFDIRVTEIINANTIRLSTGKTLTFASTGHGIEVGQRIRMS